MLDPAACHRANGWWGDQTFLGDRRRDTREIGHKSVIINYRQHGRPNVRITFAELVRLTGRSAVVLRRLGVSGDTETVQFLRKVELRTRFGEA